MDAFIEKLALPQPNPGGGAASAHGAILALGIAKKIVNLEMLRQTCGSASLVEPSLDTLEELETRLLSLRDEDGRSYLRLALARTEGRGPKLQQALEQATDCPVLIMTASLKLLTCLSKIAAWCKRHLISDLKVAAEFALAAVRGACHIAMANASHIEDSDKRAVRSEQIGDLLQEAETVFRNILKLVHSRSWGK